MRIETVPPDPAVLRTLAGIDGQISREFISKHLGKHLHLIFLRELKAPVGTEIQKNVLFPMQMQLQDDGIRGRTRDVR